MPIDPNIAIDPKRSKKERPDDTWPEYEPIERTNLAFWIKETGQAKWFPILRGSPPEKPLGTSADQTHENDGPWFLSERVVTARRRAGKFLFLLGKTKLGNRITQCSQSMILLHAETKKPISHMPMIASCESKFCPKCAIERTVHRARQIGEVCRIAKTNGSRISHTVYTIPNCQPSELKKALETIKNSFRILRGAAGGKSKPIAPFDEVKGGIWNLEVTYNSRTDSWHPHIHALIDAGYMPCRELSAAWGQAAEAAGFRARSWRVDIGELKNERGILEVAKYAIKPLKTSGINASERWTELVDALNNCRCVDSWGTLKLPPIKPSRPDDAESEWTIVKGGTKKILEDFHGEEWTDEIKVQILSTDGTARIAAKHYDPAHLILVGTKGKSKCQSHDQ